MTPNIKQLFIRFLKLHKCYNEYIYNAYTYPSMSDDRPLTRKLNDIFPRNPKNYMVLMFGWSRTLQGDYFWHEKLMEWENFYKITMAKLIYDDFYAKYMSNKISKDTLVHCVALKYNLCFPIALDITHYTLQQWE